MRKWKRKRKEEKPQKKTTEKDIYASWICESLGLRKSQQCRNSIDKKSLNPSVFCCALQKVVTDFNKYSSKMLNKIIPKTIHPLFYVS